MDASVEDSIDLDTSLADAQFRDAGTDSPSPTDGGPGTDAATMDAAADTMNDVPPPVCDEWTTVATLDVGTAPSELEVAIGPSGVFAIRSDANAYYVDASGSEHISSDSAALSFHSGALYGLRTAVSFRSGLSEWNSGRSWTSVGELINCTAGGPTALASDGALLWAACGTNAVHDPGATGTPALVMATLDGGVLSTAPAPTTALDQLEFARVSPRFEPSLNGTIILTLTAPAFAEYASTEYRGAAWQDFESNRLTSDPGEYFAAGVPGGNRYIYSLGPFALMSGVGDPVGDNLDVSGIALTPDGPLWIGQLQTSTVLVLNQPDGSTETRDGAELSVLSGNGEKLALLYAVGREVVLEERRHCP